MPPTPSKTPPFQPLCSAFSTLTALVALLAPAGLVAACQPSPPPPARPFSPVLDPPPGQWSAPDTQSTLEQSCIAGGGTIGRFPNDGQGCHDECVRSRICLKAPSSHCECGPARCWNGDTCVPGGIWTVTPPHTRN
ncbi:MAG: hypothetical protein IPK82_03775 [Polyangiaceae bacterium]|nr:hypothetical protein [Polyangiaceae bacterium]